MTESTGQGISAALAEKLQAFAGTLPAEEQARLQQIAERAASPEQGDVQGYALGGAAPRGLQAAGHPAEQVTFDLPPALVDKLRAFAATLSAEERAEVQQGAQVIQGEVQGYDFGGIVRDHRTPYGGATVRDHRGGSDSGIDWTTVGIGALITVGEILAFV